MSSLLLLLPTSRFGWRGNKPPTFDLGPGSTIDDTSSINNMPPFNTYSDPYLRTLTPSNLSLRGVTPPKYLDNPPK